MEETDQSYSADVEASLEDCVAVLLDFERYPDWSSPIVRVSVLERDAQGRARDVEFELDMTLRTVSYILRYDYALPERAKWESVGGDVRSVDGSYEFEVLPGGGVRATCRQVVDLGFWIPGALRRMVEKQALRDSVNEFKAEAERRAAARG